QRLARSGGRDQQHRTAGTRLCQKLELVCARSPAAAGKPTQKRLGQKRGRRKHVHDRGTNRTTFRCRLGRGKRPLRCTAWIERALRSRPKVSSPAKPASRHGSLLCPSSLDGGTGSDWSVPVIAPFTSYLRAMRPEDILLRTPAGICCRIGGFHIDPTRAVEKAVITHAHGDHARAGHGAVLAPQ